MKRFSLAALLLVATGVLSACDNLPRSAATEGEIIAPADKDGPPELAVYPVTRALLPTFDSWPQTGGIYQNWITRQRGPASQVIAPGDKIDLIIWNSEENSLLAAPGQKAVELQQVPVSPSGSIFLPYLERVVISGMTPDEAREQIQSQLEVIIPAAQVQLNVVEGRRNSVDLVGGVGSPGSYALEDRDTTILSLLAQSGGVSSSLTNPQIRLVRDGQRYGTSVRRLYATPDFDTTLRGGDKIIIEDDPRYFIALGASGQQTPIRFAKDSYSALDAVSAMGGVSERRADPGGILILREYPSSAISSDGRGPAHERVVFNLNLTTADGLFSARQFKLASEDLVYVSESPITATQTIFNLIGSAFVVTNQAGSTF